MPPPFPPRAWQEGLDITELTPDYVRNNYLLGVTLGAAWENGAGDAAIQTAITALVNEAQSKLGIRFMTQHILTYPDPGLVAGVDYDLVTDPLYYTEPPPDADTWVIPLPYANVQAVDRVRLFYGNPRTTPPQDALITIPSEWILFRAKEGVLRLTPSLRGNTWIGEFGSTLIGNYFGRQEIPGAWAVDYWVGFGQIDADIARWISLGVAIQTLALVGAGGDIGAGLSSESLTQDGQTESVQHYQGTFGPYTGLINFYKDQRKEIDIWNKRLAKKGIKVGIW